MADAKTWEKRVEDWRASGQTAQQFASAHGYARSSLIWWSSRLSAEKRGVVQVVRASETVVRESAIELEVGPARIRLRAGFDRSALRDLLAVLRGEATS